MSGVAQMAARTLERDELTAAEAGEARDRVRARRREVRARYDAIKEKPVGPERREVLASGDVARIRELDDEARELSAELAALKVQDDELGRRVMVLRAREAGAAAPGEYRTLARDLDAEAEARAAYERARQAVDARLRQIRHARSDVNYARNTAGIRVEIPPADPALLARWIELRGFEYDDGWGQHFRTIEQTADALGLEVPDAARGLKLA